MAKFLEGEGRHALQKECRHGRSWGSRLGKFRWQTGHVSRRLAPLARGFSPRACLLSASFSTAQAAASPVSRLSTRPSISSTFSLRGFDPPPPIRVGLRDARVSRVRRPPCSTTHERGCAERICSHLHFPSSLSPGASPPSPLFCVFLKHSARRERERAIRGFR